MTDSKYLRSEAANLRRKMQTKLNDAEKANLRAEALNKMGITLVPLTKLKKQINVTLRHFS